MIIKGWQKTSLIDYPKKIASVIFTVDCNFRCHYCHNPELINHRDLQKINEEEIFNHLISRKKLIDGVCITGGEPTLQKDLTDFAFKLKDLGFLVKLDTNGTNPKVIQTMITENLVDYIAMDIKAPPEKYDLVANTKVQVENIQKTIDIIRNSSKDYEFRTTILPKLITKQDLLSIAEWIKGSKAYYLQQFRSIKTLNPEYRSESAYTEEELRQFIKLLKPYFDICELRT